jgi:hypothetical protein
MGCGLSVRATDSGVVEDRRMHTVDAIEPEDVVAIDVQPVVDAMHDRPDVPSMRWDAARRDVVVDVTFPDGAECVIGVAINGPCSLLYGLQEGDFGANFMCCNGRCESGDCENRTPEGIPKCGGRPCDLRAGQLCCPDIGCVPRDRNLCP